MIVLLKSLNIMWTLYVAIVDNLLLDHVGRITPYPHTELAICSFLNGWWVANVILMTSHKTYLPTMDFDCVFSLDTRKVHLIILTANILFKLAWGHVWNVEYCLFSEWH